EDPFLHLRRQTDERLFGEVRVLAGQVVVAEHLLASEPLLCKRRIRVPRDQMDGKPAEDRPLILCEYRRDRREKCWLVLDERLSGGAQRRDQQVTSLEVVSAGDRLAPDRRVVVVADAPLRREVF